MFTKVKKIIVYATMPVVLSLYSHSVGASQTVTHQEVRTDTEDVMTMRTRMVEAAEQIGPQDEAKSSTWTQTIGSALGATVKYPFQQLKTLFLYQNPTKIKPEEAKIRQAGIEEVLRQDQAVCDGISGLLGEYSHSHNPKPTTSTWKHTAGAAVELTGQFLGTLFFPPVSVIAQAPEAGFNAAKQEVYKIGEKGIPTYTWDVGTKVVQTVAHNPLSAASAVIIPVAFALNYGNSTQLTNFLIGMGFETAGGISKAKMWDNLAQSMQNDSRWTKAAKTAIYCGALYCILRNFPVAQAAQFTFGTEFLISNEANVAPSLASSGNTLCVTWGNTTHIKQAFYDATTGALIAGPNVINTLQTSATSEPFTGFLDPTHSFTSWVSNTNQIVGIKSTLAGPIGSEVTLNQITTGTHGNPTWMLLGDGQIMQVWDHNPGTHSAVEYGLLNPNTLINLSGDLSMSGFPTADQAIPACAPFGNKIACTWQGFQSGNWAPYRAILNGTDGSIISGGNGVNPPIAGTDQVQPIPITLAGNPYVFWINGQDLDGVALTAAGLPTGPVLKFNVNSKLSPLVSVAATTATDGTGLVLWPGRIGVGNPAIYGSSISSSLSIVEPETAVSMGTNSQALPDVGSVPGGGVLGVWSGDNGGSKIGFLGSFATNGGTGVSTTTPASTTGITGTTTATTTVNATTKPSEAYSNAPGILSLATLLISLYAAL